MSSISHGVAYTKVQTCTSGIYNAYDKMVLFTSNKVKV